MPKCADSQGEIPVSFLGKKSNQAKKQQKKIGLDFYFFFNLVGVFFLVI